METIQFDFTELKRYLGERSNSPVQIDDNRKLGEEVTGGTVARRDDRGGGGDEGAGPLQTGTRAGAKLEPDPDRNGRLLRLALEFGKLPVPGANSKSATSLS